MGSEGSLGLRELLLLSVGGMIGSAAFYFPAFTGQWVGPAAILAWAAAGVGMTTVALTYAELSTAFPEAGGPAVFPAETFGRHPVVRRFASYLEGVCYALGWTFGVAVSAWFVAFYVARIPAFAGATSLQLGLALLAIVATAVVALSGVEVTARVNLVLTAAVLAVLVLVAAAGFAGGSTRNLSPLFTGDSFGFLEAVGVAITGFGAWTVVPSVADDVRRPGWTIPRAIVGSLLVTTVLYTAVVLALHLVVPGSAFQPGNPVYYAPLATLATDAGVPVLANYLIPFGALVAIFTTMLVGTTSAARVLYALGDRGTLPGVLARTDDRTDTPWVAVLVIVAAAGVVVFLKDLATGIVLAALVGTAIPYFINVLAYVGFRVYRDDVTPAFRAPGGLGMAAVALAFLVLLSVGLGLDQPTWAGGVLAAILVGFVLVELRRRYGVGRPQPE